MDGEAELVAVVTCPKQNENLVLDDYENSARVGFGVEERSCAVCVGVCAVSPSPLSPTLPQERRENSGTSGSVKHFFSCPVWMCATWMIETQTRVRREKSVTSCAGSVLHDVPFPRDLGKIHSFFRPVLAASQGEMNVKLTRVSALLRCRSALCRI